MVAKPLSRPIRVVLRWQLIVTAVLTLAAALLWGVNGALSAAFGGAINLVSGWVYGWRVSQGEARTAGEALVAMLRAWGIKVLLIVAGLLLVMKWYQDLVPTAFFATFVITLAVFAAAVAVRDADADKDNTPGPPGTRDHPR